MSEPAREDALFRRNDELGPLELALVEFGAHADEFEVVAQLVDVAHARELKRGRRFELADRLIDALRCAARARCASSATSLLPFPALKLYTTARSVQGSFRWRKPPRCSAARRAGLGSGLGAASSRTTVWGTRT